MSNTELTVHKGELLEMVANHTIVGRVGSVRYAPIRTDTVYEKIKK